MPADTQRQRLQREPGLDAQRLAQRDRGLRQLTELLHVLGSAQRHGAVEPDHQVVVADQPVGRGAQLVDGRHRTTRRTVERAADVDHLAAAFRQLAQRQRHCGN